MLEVKDLKAGIEDKEILHGISYAFAPGNVYALMGPNGSGKSTLAQTIMGNPAYEIADGSKIIVDGEDVTELESFERAKKGVFLSFQSPQELAGVNIFQMLRVALEGKKEPVEIREQIKQLAEKLKIKEELLSRSLNEDFSGGEKKKMEVLQAAIIDAKYLFFDEIDTGTDVDALKIIGEFLHKMKNEDRAIVMITHYTRLLKYIQPDKVLVVKDGELVADEDGTLATEIEEKGYEVVEQK